MDSHKVVNLIYLQDAAEVDYLYDIADEDVKAEFQSFCNIQDEELKMAKGNNPDNVLIPYSWNGRPNELPWYQQEDIRFDPTAISVIIPRTGTSFRIKGIGRRIVLTNPAMHDGKEPRYVISTVDHNTNHLIKGLSSADQPFLGLESLFTPNYFTQLQALAESHVSGIIIPNNDVITVPSASREYF